MKLTTRQQKFVDEYLLDFNAKHAAIRAGYSEKTAQEQGSRLLTYVHVQRAINESLDGRRESIGVKVNDIVDGLLEIAHDAKAPAKDRLKAFELLGKHKGMFIDKQEIQVSGVEKLLDDLED